MKSKYLSPDEVRALRSHLTAAEWLPLWVAAETGLRIGDVVALRRASVKSDGIHYRAQKTHKSGVAPISAALRRALGDRRGGWLFPSPYRAGAHLTRQAAWQRIKRAADRAGIDLDGCSPHSLRKSFAVELYREHGFRAVQDALQHANAATSEIYAFADWSTGENAGLPLCRRDLQMIVKMVLEALGDTRQIKPESRSKRGKGRA